MMSTLGFGDAASGLTLRAVACGSAIGILMCFSNTWFGAQTGFVTMASLQSALLAHGLFGLCARWRGPAACPSLTVSEHVLLTSVATAAATMPLAAGFIGIIPALRILEARGEAGSSTLPLQSAGTQILWSLSVCFFGVFVAVPLRGYLTTLRFPSGTATAVAINGLRAHSSGSAASVGFPVDVTSTVNPLAVVKVQPSEPQHAIAQPAAEAAPVAVTAEPLPTPSLRQAVYAFAASAALSLAAFFLPVLGGVPVFTFVGLPGVSAWTWVLTLSLSYVGQGMIMGLHTCMSMAAGAFVAWGVIGPACEAAGWVTVPRAYGPTGGRGFLLWISLAILLAETAASVSLTLWGMLRCTRGGDDVNAPTAVPPSTETSAGGIELAAVVSGTGPATSGGLVTDDELGGGYDERSVVGSEAADKSLRMEATSPTESEPMAPPPTPLPSADGVSGAAGALDESAPARLSLTASPPMEVLPTWMWGAGLAATSAVAVVALIPLANVTFGEALLAVVFSLPISVIAVRCLGETDLNPVSGLGKLTQVIFGALSPANLVGNIIAGAVAEAAAQQAGDLMQDLKTGWLLRVPLRAQFSGQIIGSLVSVFAATAAFAVFDAAYGVPSLTLPAPTAAIWVSMAELMSGAGALPVHVVPFMAVGAVASFAVALIIALADGAGAGTGPPSALRRAARRAAPFLPSPTAFSIGMYITANWTLPRLAGALLAAALARRGVSQQDSIMLATGFVLGEGVMALLTALLATFGVRPLSCGGCAPGMCGNWC